MRHPSSYAIVVGMKNCTGSINTQRHMIHSQNGKWIRKTKEESERWCDWDKTNHQVTFEDGKLLHKPAFIVAVSFFYSQYKYRYL